MPKIGEKTVSKLTNRATQLSIFFSMIEPVPEGWCRHSGGGANGPKQSDELLSCTEYRMLQNAWRKALRWTPGLDRALSVMLASVTSTMSVGDQLWVKVVGPASCLDADTHVRYVIRQKNGKLVNKKGGKIKNLFRRFNNRNQSPVDYFIQSVTDEGVVRLNKINAVVYNGVRSLLEIRTESGKRIKLTPDHEVMTGEGYVRSDKLAVGSILMVNNGKTQKKGRTKAQGRKEVLVKYHKNATTKTINGCVYYRIYTYHAAYEAHANGMDYDQYVEFLNSATKSSIDRLWAIPRGTHVHHKDENFLNDSIDNLELIDPSSHGVEHSDSATKFLAINVEQDRVVSIRKMGVGRVFDIKVDDPYRNFVAEGIVVHNCGKSTLCEALSVNHEYVLAKSTLTGFHSGFKSDSEGAEDNSLVLKANGKTLVIKDGDTLLQMPNLGQILSQARDLYDGSSRTYYKNKMSKDYKGLRMTWILCGTASLASIDQSELGERFLNCTIMDGIDDELEEEILWRAANKARVNVTRESGDNTETQHDAALSEAMRLTGGYVGYLRKNANEILSSTDMSEESLRLCTRYGKFIAYMRARPSKMQEEKAEREMAGRLVIQITRLAMCLAAVLNRKTVDEEVMDRTRAVVLDTAKGVTMDIAKYLYNQPNGAETQAIVLKMNQEFGKIQKLLRFLSKIGAIEPKLPESEKIKHPKPRWHLTDTMRKLYKAVMEKNDA